MMQPGLFGLRHTNRDFTSVDGWSKNVFNSAFPASLACYMHSKGISPIYLQLNPQGKIYHSSIDVDVLFGQDPNSNDLFFSFETDFVPYQQLVVNNVPRIDLVTMSRHSSTPLRGLEIKLTALPDNSTYSLSDEAYGAEIVVRPDTIVYLALSIAWGFKDKIDTLKSLFAAAPISILDWADGDEVMPFIPQMVTILNSVMNHHTARQQPLLMQPIWKTQGKKLLLHEDAFDIFVWSDFAFTRLFFDAARDQMTRISRQARSVIWLMKMLLDFAEDGKINHRKVIDELSHATKNDKAFSVPGRLTHPYMTSAALTKPRIQRRELKHIILGGGQNLLSPERRLDAAILGTPELFE